MSTLYELSAEIESLERQMIDPETGEIDEDVLKALDALQMEKQEKVDNIACLIKSLKADVDGIDSEISNLKKRKEPKKNKIERLKKYLTDYCDGESYETSRSKVSFRPSSRVIVADEWEKLLPDKYIRCTTVSAPDKAGLKKALDKGEEISGASLEKYQNIQIG